MNLTVSGASNVASVDALSSVRKQHVMSSSEAGRAAASGDRSEISKPADLLARLAEQKSADPEGFKQAMSAISEKLGQAAEAASSPEEAQALKDLAGKFQSAGESGDLSALASPKRGSHPPPPGGPQGAGGPKGPPPSGGHGGPGGPKKADAADAKSASTSAAKDPADTDEDGKVSAKEKAAYEAAQAKKAAASYEATAKSDHEHGMHKVFETLKSVVDSVLSPT